jgi:hypothetical protein
MWLKERLGLDINLGKSKITNMRKNYTTFLGFKLRVRKGKGKKYTNRSHMSDKAKTKAKETIKNKIRILQKNPNKENVNKYNGTVLSLQDYYKIATMVNADFSEIAYIVNKSLRCRTRSISSDNGKESKAYKKYYSGYNYQKVYVAKTALFPISAVKFAIPKCFSQEITSYTPEGRKKIHTSLQFDTSIMIHLKLNEASLKKLNKLRSKVGNDRLSVN